jgi:Tol biopolymer transport system component
VRVSLDLRGGDADAVSEHPRLSADGRAVVFTSRASDLVPGDRQGHADVFLRDLGRGTTTRVSVDRRGGDPNDDSVDASVSADGRRVAFTSYASDLVASDTNGASDVFVRDLPAGTTTRVSVDTAGGEPNGASDLPWISADGRYVAFTSLASDLMAGDGNHAGDVFLRDLVAGTTTRVSVDVAGGDADGPSYDPTVSADGRHVAFTSFATDLVGGDANGAWDVFLRDVVAGTTTRVSVDAAGGDAGADSFATSLSATGRYVAFFSSAADLVAPDPNGAIDVFLRDVVAGTTTRISDDAAGGPADGPSFSASVSATGRYVAFYSQATDLAGADANRTDDVFVRDVPAASTVRVSVDLAGGDPDGLSVSPSLDASGRVVAFSSWASDLVAGDGNGVSDVFLVDLR